MIRKLSVQLLLILALMAVCSWSVIAQLAPPPNEMLHWIRVSDNHAAGDTSTIYFGNHVNGTYDVDAVLYEYQAPPDPPAFFTRFTSIGGGRVNTWGTYGLLNKDMREIPASPTKKDSFYVKVKNPDGVGADNVVLVWPDQSYIEARCDSMILVVVGDAGGASGIPGGRLNMATTNTATILNPYMLTDDGGWNPTAPELKLRIFKYGTKTPNLDAVKRESNLAPSSFGLHQNYPNPFNPSTHFTFDIRNAGLTDVSIYNMLGQKVATLVAKELPVGTYAATWNGMNDEGIAVTSGVYFVRMSVHADGVNEFSAVRKMVLMK